uniref:2'-5' oligoadenylate synthetase 1E n=1 Tax=Mus musculus TaxID=10090 RepID=A0A0J9YV17_MOUSE
MARELFRTPIWRLDNFIEDQLLPDTTFLTELRADIDSISAFLKERCFQGATHPMRVARVVMMKGDTASPLNPLTTTKSTPNSSMSAPPWRRRASSPSASPTFIRAS